MAAPFDGSRTPTKEEFLARAAQLQLQSEMMAREARDFLFRGMGDDRSTAWDKSSSRIGYYQKHDDDSETFVPYQSWQDS